MWWVVAAAAQNVTLGTSRAPGDPRTALSEALLAGASGDPEGEIRALMELTHSLQATDPELGETLYWLGTSLFGLGRADEAREALARGIRTGACPQCRDLLEQIDIDDRSIRALPVRMTFTAQEPAVFHPWRYEDVGETGRVPASNDRNDWVLQWTTTLRFGDPDRLTIGLDCPPASPAPTAIAFEVFSHQQDALLDVVVVDVHGRRYEMPQPAQAPRGLPSKVEVLLSTLVPVDSTEPLDPSTIVLLHVVDRTGTRSSGLNRLWLDDIEIR